MEDLEYKIGHVEIEPFDIRLPTSYPGDSYHKFLLEDVGGDVSIYLMRESKHRYIVEEHHLGSRGKILGGGVVYLDDADRLNLGFTSFDYGPISQEMAEIFVKLLVPEFKERGIDVKGTVANPKP